MGKLRKTKRQKKLADLHAQNTPSPKGTTSPSFTFSPPSEQTQTTTAYSSSITLPNIKPDLLKTVSLTSAIIIAELVLFFVL